MGPQLETDYCDYFDVGLYDRMFDGSWNTVRHHRMYQVNKIQILVLYMSSVLFLFLFLLCLNSQHKFVKILSNPGHGNLGV